MQVVKRIMFFLITAGCCFGQNIDSLPHYKPEQRVSGIIRIWGHGAWGHDYMNTLVRRWEEGFRQYQPDVRFENKLMGTASAIGSLYAGAGDIALMGREIWPIEITAFRQVRHYEPLGIDVLTGSLDVRNKEYALAIFVHKSNPLSKLTLAQVGAIFRCEPSGFSSIRTWGDLGLKGEWKDKPIHLYGFGINRGFAYFLEQRVLHSRRWNPEMEEFDDLKQADGSIVDAGRRVTDALSGDQYGIAYSSMMYTSPNVKPLSLATKGSSVYVAPTAETVRERSYPLTNWITGFIDREPGKPVAPHIKEFLKYILSHEGQQIVIQDGDYLPLTDRIARQELHKLE